jgi:hypothetical protein
MSYHIYCLNYGDKRTATITASFAAVGLSDKVTFYSGIDVSKMKKANNYLPEVNCGMYKAWSATMGHRKMMKIFLETSDAEFGIFCENDIRLHKNIKKEIPYYLEKFQELNLEILLFGYLLTDKKTELSGKILSNIYDINSVPGAQMYLLTRAKCEEFVKKYDINYLIASQYHPDKYFTFPDMIFTKHGRKAAIYPMLAVEFISNDWQSWHSGPPAFGHQYTCMKNNLTNDYL